MGAPAFITNATMYGNALHALASALLFVALSLGYAWLVKERFEPLADADGA